jgi:hypothetical protein
MIVLEDRGDLLIIQTKDGITTVPKTPYYKVKYIDYQGNRISYRFGDPSKRVEETYDDGIFNCYFGDRHIQIRDGNAVANAMTAYNETKNSEQFETLFNKFYMKEHKYEILDGFFAALNDRVKRAYGEGMYVIDDIFAVDGHANAYVLTEKESGDFDWRPLCIVVQGTLQNKNIETPLGCLELDVTLQSIIAKVMYLLNPNPEDCVFMRQLPPNIQRMVTRRYNQNTKQSW